MGLRDHWRLKHCGVQAIDNSLVFPVFQATELSCKTELVWDALLSSNILVKLVFAKLNIRFHLWTELDRVCWLWYSVSCI